MAKSETQSSQGQTDDKKKKKDFEKKQKERLSRRKQREQKEMKRIRSIIDFPFKFLFQASLVIGLVFFIFKFFGQSEAIGTSLLIAFIVFAAVYIGVGGIMMLVLFFVSANKKEKLREMIRQEKEQKKLLEQKRAEEEARLESQFNNGLAEEMRRRQESSRAANREIPNQPGQTASGSTNDTGATDFVSQNTMNDEINNDDL
jgi:hypothetical protein